MNYLIKHAHDEGIYATAYKRPEDLTLTLTMSQDVINNLTPYDLKTYESIIQSGFTILRLSGKPQTKIEVDNQVWYFSQQDGYWVCVGAVYGHRVCKSVQRTIRRAIKYLKEAEHERQVA